MKVCILDAWDPEDPALVNSHWVAEQTYAVLLEHTEASEIKVVADAIDRAIIRVELNGSHNGFVFLGHGRDHVLFQRCDERGKPIPLIDATDAPFVGPRWFHAFACLSGNTLAFNALDAGIAAYLGYRVAVNVEWEPLQLPAEIIMVLRDLVTAATMKLALGERSTEVIRPDVRSIAVRLRKVIRYHRDALELKHLMGLRAFANLLHKDLVLEGTEVRP
jgi:hypothetical protein